MMVYWQGGGLKSLFFTGGVEANFPFVDYVNSLLAWPAPVHWYNFTHRTPNPVQGKEYFPLLSKVVISISKPQSPDSPTDTTSASLLLQQRNVSLCL